MAVENSPIKIGALALDNFEVPEALRFGGRQRLVVHALTGGKRIVEQLGPDDDRIQFKGTFSGPTAEARARAFDSLRMSGEIVWLTWESFRRQVIVEQFTAHYTSPWWIHYEICCIVVRQAQAVSAGISNVSAVIASDFASALAMAAGSGISLSTLQTAIFSANALTAGTAAQTSAVMEISSTMDEINERVDERSCRLTAPAQTNLGPAALSRGYASIVDCAGSLAATCAMRGYVGRIGVNLTGTDN